MLRRIALSISIAGSALGVLAASAHAGPRPSYGAIVTLEHGVRVFRALPPDAVYDDGYGAVLSTSNGHYSVPAAGRAYEWRPGFYRVLAGGER